MSARVIAAFVDQQTGKRINPGDPLPAGLTEDRQQKLLKAGCIVLEGAGETKPAAKTGKGKRKAAAKGAAASNTLFPEGGNPEGSAADDNAGTDPEGGNAGTDPEALAGGDGGDTGAGSEPDEGGREAGDEQSQDDSSR